jgi:hypothetical protein
MNVKQDGLFVRVSKPVSGFTRVTRNHQQKRLKKELTYRMMHSPMDDTECGGTGCKSKLSKRVSEGCGTLGIWEVRVYGCMSILILPRPLYDTTDSDGCLIWNQK